MSSPKIFPIKESESEIKKIIKTSAPIISNRFKALLVFKRFEKTGISKRQVAEEIGVNQNSIQTWRSMYIKGGAELLQTHSNIGYKPSVINNQQEKVLAEKLNDPFNGIVGFVELLAWFNEKFNTDINYKTFHGFVVRKFQAKIKVARKSHVNKDKDAVDAFKKTSTKSAKKSVTNLKKIIKR
jgi:transposase